MNYSIPTHELMVAEDAVSTFKKNNQVVPNVDNIKCTRYAIEAEVKMTKADYGITISVCMEHGAFTATAHDAQAACSILQHQLADAIRGH